MKNRLFAFAGLGMALAYLVPNHYPPWASFHADAIVALAFIPLLMWVIFSSGTLPWLTVGFLMLGCVPLLQFAGGGIVFLGDAVIASLYLIGFALATLCGARAAPSGDGSLIDLAPLQAALVIAAVLSTGIAVHQWLDLGLLAVFIVGLPGDSRPFGNLAQPNQLATLLMLGIAALVFLYEAGIVRAAIAVVAVLILAFGLSLTQSRTAVLGLIYACLHYCLLRRRVSLRTKPWAFVVVSVVFLGCLWAWVPINEFLLLSRNQSLAERMGQNLRITLWHSMIAATTLHPWIGYGWNQISLAQQATALDYPATHWWFESAHNLGLDLALWCGIPLAFLVCIGLAVWFFRRFWACDNPLSWSLLLGIGFVFCHSMVEYPMTYAYFLLPIGVVMGALSSDHCISMRRRKFSKIVGSLQVSVALISVVAFSKIVFEYLALEEEWRNIRMERVFVSVDSTPPVSGIGILTQLQARAQFARLSVSAGMTFDQIEWMRRVAERYPTVNFMLPYAKALALNGQPAAASKVLALMCRIQSPSVCRRAMQEWGGIDGALITE